MSLFVMANRMLILYSVLYCIGDFLRAFFYRNDQSASAIGISFFFLFLSIWLLLNSIIYYKAFMEEMEAYHTGGQHAVEGTGVIGTSSDSEHSVVDGAGSKSGPAPPVMPEQKNETVQQTYRRWTYYLNSQAGLAYFLNIVGSFGYLLSSLISVFLALNTDNNGRDVDKASLILDSINMFVFIFDGFLFWKVWYYETDEPTFAARWKNVYMWGNLCNTGSSIAYFCFIVWTLDQKFYIDSEVNSPQAKTDPDFIDEQFIQVVFKQRTMYFVADIVYLIYAIILEYAWNKDSGRRGNVELKAVQIHV